MRIVGVIRVYRAFKGLKLKQFAEELDITPRELSALESDKTPSAATLVKVIKWALSEEPTTPPPTDAEIVKDK